MSNSFGHLVRLTVFGQSHSEAIGSVLDGIPAAVRVDMEAVRRFMDRRAPGKSNISTSRRETDYPRIISGLVDGVTCGAPIVAVISNSDVRSEDYKALRDIPRPMHADYPAHVKYHGANDIRGGGQFSGRLTAPLCFAGAVAIQLLRQKGIFIGAHIASIGNVSDAELDPASVDQNTLLSLADKDFPVLDDSAGEKMRAQIEKAREELDSVGGVIECAVTGLPPGIGEPLYGSIESRLSTALFSIPAVKGVSFGEGFGACSMRGSLYNDAYVMKNGQVVTETNRHGGILGGISTGMPLLFQVAVKPTSSIASPQRSVSLSRGENTTLAVKGRHDPCIVPRALPCVEAAAALVLLDLIMESKGRDEWNSER